MLILLLIHIIVYSSVCVSMRGLYISSALAAFCTRNIQSGAWMLYVHVCVRERKRETVFVCEQTVYALVVPPPLMCGLESVPLPRSLALGALPCRMNNGKQRTVYHIHLPPLPLSLHPAYLTKSCCVFVKGLTITEGNSYTSDLGLYISFLYGCDWVSMCMWESVRVWMKQGCIRAQHFPM